MPDWLEPKIDILPAAQPRAGHVGRARSDRLGGSLSTVLHDFSRYIVAWKLCITMKAADATAMLEPTLQASRLDKARVMHRPRQRTL